MFLSGSCDMAKRFLSEYWFVLLLVFAVALQFWVLAPDLSSGLSAYRFPQCFSLLSSVCSAVGFPWLLSPALSELLRASSSEPCAR